MGGFKKALVEQPTLLLGAVGALFGNTYCVVGFILKREVRYPAQWMEYMLLDQATGTYVQLAVFEGHWMFVEPVQGGYKVGRPTSRNAYVFTNDTNYALYNRYQQQVLYAMGEFDWNIFDDEKLNISEFIAPPYMLVQERNPRTKKSEWYKATYVEPAAVQAAFNLEPQRMPWRQGVGAIQPAPGEASWPVLMWFSWLMALIIVVTQALFLFVKPQQELLNQQFRSQPTTLDNTVTASAAGSNNVIVTSSFEVKGPAALEFDLRSSLSNQWLEIPVSLVNEKTGQSYEFTKSLEHYFGIEDGESWSEGSENDNATLAGIPSGRYHLNIYPTTEAGLDLPINLVVTQNTPLHSNAILFLLMLAIYPGIQFFRRYNHEKTRWLNSDYGPQEAE
ncbi:DUF4178 domain-containing protein [Hymenobacter tibetensis]|uniref:DUF4178 domain-containing protein n=2 Tax=Hymenobacter tibetensis TaxID=497967 RepID=A0ABY4D6H7_9BACT|nr:DUF4178 domain-containing protein [Hymenobacter tibetensis]UOG77220.1 DUF4178 domain-containing protein [Hymenobacter tibetensis]